MSDSSRDVQVLTPQRPALDLACVRSLKSDIEAARASGARAIAIDLSSIVTQTPQGLSQLIELSSGQPSQHVVLCCLPRSLMACAIDLGMAEVFPIYATLDALRSAFEEER